MKKINKWLKALAARIVIVLFLFFLVIFMPLANADEYVLNDIVNELRVNKSELKNNEY